MEQDARDAKIWVWIFWISNAKTCQQVLRTKTDFEKFNLSQFDENFKQFFFLNFRSRVQRTKETIGKEIGDANAMQMDANLFVGDIQGIKKAKTESKKIASSASGTHYLYVQGLSQNNSINGNDQNENDDEVQILEPTEFKVSNRSGGIFFKKEVLSEHDDDDEDIFQDEILKVIQSEAAMKQDSSTELIAQSKNEPMKLNFAMPSTSANLNRNDAISDTSSSDDNDEDFEEVTTLKKNEVLEIGTKMISRKKYQSSQHFSAFFQNSNLNQRVWKMTFLLTYLELKVKTMKLNWKKIQMKK